MMKYALAIAAGTATVMFLTGPVSAQLVKVDFIAKQRESNKAIYSAAVSGGLGALVAVLIVAS